MDWTSTAIALSGTALGGSLTIAGQALADKRAQRDATRQIKYAAAAASTDRVRSNLAALVERVFDDFSSYRPRVADAYANLIGLQLGNEMESLRREIGQTHDKCRSLIARLPGAAVRAAAHDVYDQWANFAATVEDDVSNGTQQAALISADVNESANRFAQVVTEYLKRLDQDADASL